MYLSSHFNVSLEVFFFQVSKIKKIEPDHYSFILVQHGSITIAEQEQSYILSQGDVFLMEPEHSYEFNYFSRNFCLNISFGTAFISSLLPRGGVLMCNSTVGKKQDYQRLVKVLTDIAMEYPQPDNEARMLALVYQFIDVLQTRYIRTEAPSGNDVAANRIHEIEDYIQQNYHLPLSLQELADQMYLSPQYLSKFIRQHMGITFIHYLNQVRMEHAYEELMNTDHSVTEIAFNNGFSNTAAFNKSFRELYHESPSAHRLAKKQTEAPASSTLTGSQEFQRFMAQQSPEQPLELIQVFADHSEPFYPSWSDTINIGALSHALSIEFHDIFMDFQKHVHFRYVRFDSVFAEEIMRPLRDRRGFDFTNLNMILDFFEEIHIIPFIELSFKPRKRDLINFLGDTAEESFRDAKDEAYYRYAFDNFLRHCINRYGYMTVSQWRFELWAKHDEELYYIESAREYADRFAAYRNILKNLIPECAIGGPGFNTSSDRIKMIEILEELKRRKLQPDFYSIYIYCHAPGRYDSRDTTLNTHMIISEDANVFTEDFLSFKRMIREIMADDTPVYITEFNSGLVGNNYVSGSLFQASFICRSILRVFRETTCVAYWLFADSTLHMLGKPQQYSTGNGLIDVHGLPKASMFAYILLARMEPKLVALGENYLVTTSGTNRFQVLIYHYVHYNRQYCINYRIPVSIEHTYDVFEEAPAKTMRIRLSGIPAGRYKLVRHRLNRRHGSLLDTFTESFREGVQSPSELNYMLLNMQRYELDYYYHLIRPKQEILYLDNSRGEGFTLELTLEPHEVVLYEFARKA